MVSVEAAGVARLLFLSAAVLAAVVAVLVLVLVFPPFYLILLDLFYDLSRGYCVFTVYRIF